MTDEPTARDRLATAGLFPERIAWWFQREEGAVRVDDEPAGPDTPAPWGTRVVLRG